MGSTSARTVGNRRRRDLLQLSQCIDLDHDGPTAASGGMTEGGHGELTKALGVAPRRGPLGDPLEDRTMVHLLERPALILELWMTPDDEHERGPGMPRCGDSGDGVRRAGTARSRSTHRACR